LYNNLDRRLGALEGRAVTHRRGTYAGLVALCEAGLLAIDDLTDTELWWIVAGKAEPMPSEAEQDIRLAVVLGTSSLPTVDGL